MSSDISRESFDERKSYSSVRLQQGRMLTDADWNEQARIFQHALQSLTRGLLGPHALAPHDPETSFAVTDVSWNDQQLGCRLRPGRYYVDGVAIENHGVRDFVFPLSADTESALLYLDAWEEEIGGLQDPWLSDPALSGADTSQRTRLAWRLRCMPLESGVRVTDEVPESLLQSRPGKLKVRSTGYTGAENDVYRVQIQRAGRIGGAPQPTYKWARHNGSARAAVVKLEILDALLRIRVRPWPAGTANWRNVKVGDWVEYCSDAMDGDDPCLMPVLAVEGDQLTLEPDSSLLACLEGFSADHQWVRLWDHQGTMEADGGIPIGHDASGHGWQLLERGVQIAFESGDVRAGDAWMIPARSADGSLLWPEGQALPPAEPRRCAAPLAQATRAGADAPAHVAECRHRVEIRRSRIDE